MSANTRIVVVACLMAILSIYVVLSAPAAAMPLTHSLQFPQEDGIWGCRFHGTCPQEVTPAPDGN